MNRAAIVTGAAGGIGRVIAADLSSAGWEVVGLDRHWPEEDVPVATRHAVDLTDSRATRTLLEQVNRAHRVTGLVNCAGIVWVGRFLDGAESDWRRLTEVNFLAPILLCQMMAPVMIDLGGGSIVNITSDSGRVGAGGEAVYSATKGGLAAFSKSLAQEVGPAGVRVNCVSPGPVDSPMSGPNAELMEKLARRIPLRRTGRATDVAAAVRFLLGDEASYITGQVLSVSGGLTMAG